MWCLAINTTNLELAVEFGESLKGWLGGFITDIVEPLLASLTSTSSLSIVSIWCIFQAFLPISLATLSLTSLGNWSLLQVSTDFRTVQM